MIGLALLDYNVRECDLSGQTDSVKWVMELYIFIWLIYHSAILSLHSLSEEVLHEAQSLHCQSHAFQTEASFSYRVRACQCHSLRLQTRIRE